MNEIVAESAVAGGGEGEEVGTRREIGRPVKAAFITRDAVDVDEHPSTVRRHTPPAQVVCGEMLDSEDRPHVLLANGSAEKHALLHVKFRGRAVYRIVGPDREQQTGWPQETGGVLVEEFVMPAMGRRRAG